MSGDMSGFISNLVTLAAVVLGAVLATAGSLVTNWIEARSERERRQRDAARFFGEVLASASTIARFASESRAVGDPYGSVTLRLLRVARSELQVYERNRERLFDIPDTDLRARVHLHVLQQTVPLESIIENSVQIAAIDDELKLLTDLDPTNDPSPKRVEDLTTRRAAMHERRMGAFDQLDRILAKNDDVVKGLKPLAGTDFSAFAKAADV
jgi:hypothetical protein